MTFEHAIARAVVIDEQLSEAFEQLPGQKVDADLAARRLAAWCRAAASGDWPLFARRLERDGLSMPDVLAKFSTVRRSASLPWTDDAASIAEALQRHAESTGEPVAFEQLLAPVVDDALALLWTDVDDRAGTVLTNDARVCLRRSLLTELSSLAAPALYERFAEVGNYRQFVSDMNAAGFRRLFEDKPVLLRLMASLTRQWIETSRELIMRLNADLESVRRELLHGQAACRITTIEGDLSDPHNFGRSVRIIGFEDGTRVVYKPKDLRVDAAWHALVDRLNRTSPVDLRAARVLARDGYGWTEFIAHTSCEDSDGFSRFFRRAGGWLALLHCFVSVDMHQENIIAAGEHPVPIDLEMILQEVDSRIGHDDAHAAAMQMVVDSVMTVGLLPAYGRYSTSKIFAIGGITSNSAPRVKLTWADINSDTMRPEKVADDAATTPNLPHVSGSYARLGDHLDDFLSGFRDYAGFLRRQSPDDLFGGFVSLPIRTVLRPTRFYYMLLQRLRDHRGMDDGITWSAQADFPARLADWENDTDPIWPLHRSERAAVVELNVPYFTTTSDVDRARNRFRGLDDDEIAWQEEVIQQNIGTLRRATTVRPLVDTTGTPNSVLFTAEADDVARKLAQYAIRKGATAAWVGLDWLGDSEVSQLVVLGPDLYNGACGIALFLAAHAAVTKNESSADLALAAVDRLRESLHGRNPARMARSLGLGGGLGLGSIVYGLTVIAELLDDDDILADADAAAERVTGEIVAADRQFDVLGGSAGAILGLLRLHRRTGSADVLARANACGHHLIAQHHVGAEGALNGMSHGAAGFAYALARLASVTGEAQFATVAGEYLAFENTTFDAARGNWPDLRAGAGAKWKCKWCHGAPGIGLARAAITKHTERHRDVCLTDIRNALEGAEQGWPSPTDTLCCGTLASIEFLWEAGRVLGRTDLSALSAQRLLTVIETARAAGDYRWSHGATRFNLGMFRGIAGVGYTALRRVDDSLPNVLIWE